MSALGTKKLAVAVAGVVMLAGAGGAIAATQSSSTAPGQAYVNDLANRLGVSPSTLTGDMKAALEDQIQAAVAAGRLTQSRADALKQRVEQSNGLPFGLHRFGRGVGLGRLQGDAVTQYLGISEATLRSELAAGKSLAQITAGIPGKTLAGLEAAITASVRTRLDQAVKSGRIAGQEEQTILANLSSRLDSLVQRTWHGTLGGGMHRFFGGERPRSRAY